MILFLKLSWSLYNSRNNGTYNISYNTYNKIFICTATWMELNHITFYYINQYLHVNVSMAKYSKLLAYIFFR